MTRKPARPRPDNTQVISATEAAKNFGRLIDRVRTEHAEYLVERSGTAVARISPVPLARCTGADFVNWLRSHPRQDDAYLKAVEAGIKALNRPAIPENRWER
jgi:antitoxin (DNA-binding transcriptional repressor) of toxin-antitoxin stability system